MIDEQSASVSGETSRLDAGVGVSWPSSPVFRSSWSGGDQPA
jgi:hypothetical protein